MGIGIVAYLVGDLLILPRTNNMMATIGDGTGGSFGTMSLFKTTGLLGQGQSVINQFKKRKHSDLIGDQSVLCFRLFFFRSLDLKRRRKEPALFLIHLEDPHTQRRLGEMIFSE